MTTFIGQKHFFSFKKGAEMVNLYGAGSTAHNTKNTTTEKDSANATAYTKKMARRDELRRRREQFFAGFVPAKVSILKKGVLETRVLLPNTPLVSMARAGQRVTGQDKQGDYVLIPLNNRAGTGFYRHVILVSPEDEAAVRECSWCGHLDFDKSGMYTYICHRQTIDGKAHTLRLSRFIAARKYQQDISPYAQIHKKGHPLDFRQPQITFTVSATGFKGVVANRGSFQIFTCWGGENSYLGCTKTKEEGAQLYNRALKKAKRQNPDDKALKLVTYNTVTPLFGDDSDINHTLVD